LMRRVCIFYDYALAEKILLRAVEIARRHHVEDEVVRLLNNLATMYLDGGNIEAALAALKEAMTKSARLGGFGRDYLLNNLSLIRRRCGDAEAALTGLREAASLAKRAVCRLIIFTNQAAALLQLTRFRAAHELLTRLLPEAVMTKEDIYIIAVRLNLALASLSELRFSRALFELPHCSANRIRAVGGHYLDGRKAILHSILSGLGAVRPSGTASPPQFEPQEITMQFWGD
jgi:tetratricopeptide (TPR) repeat protein